MDKAPIERSKLVFVDGPVVDPARLRKDCLSIDDAAKRTLCGAAMAALQPVTETERQPGYGPAPVTDTRMPCPNCCGQGAMDGNILKQNHI